MTKISKIGITPHQIIRSEHLLRIIEALSGNVPNTQIEISGSVTASYFVGNGSGLTNLNISSFDEDLLANNVSYINGSFTNVEEALDSLFYINPNISGFSINPNVVEIGTTVPIVTLNWALNKIFTSLSINNGIGVITPNLLTRTQNVSLTTNTTFTITGGDGVNVDSESAGLSFRSRRWWGTNASPTLNNDDIFDLFNNELSTSRQQIRTINGGGQYIWFAFPTSYGVPSFLINNLPNTSFVTTTIPHTNTSGNTQNYYVIRTTTVQNGTLTIQIL
jgi:hypothetical protein